MLGCTGESQNREGEHHLGNVCDCPGEKCWGPDTGKCVQLISHYNGQNLQNLAWNIRRGDYQGRGNCKVLKPKF